MLLMLIWDRVMDERPEIVRSGHIMLHWQQVNVSYSRCLSEVVMWSHVRVYSKERVGIRMMSLHYARAYEFDTDQIELISKIGECALLMGI